MVLGLVYVISRLVRSHGRVALQDSVLDLLDGDWLVLPVHQPVSGQLGDQRQLVLPVLLPHWREVCLRGRRPRTHCASINSAT